MIVFNLSTPSQADGQVLIALADKTMSGMGWIKNLYGLGCLLGECSAAATYKSTGWPRPARDLQDAIGRIPKRLLRMMPILESASQTQVSQKAGAGGYLAKALREAGFPQEQKDLRADQRIDCFFRLCCSQLREVPHERIPPSTLPGSETPPDWQVIAYRLKVLMGKSQSQVADELKKKSEFRGLKVPSHAVFKVSRNGLPQAESWRTVSPLDRRGCGLSPPT